MNITELSEDETMKVRRSIRGFNTPKSKTPKQSKSRSNLNSPSTIQPLDLSSVESPSSTKTQSARSKKELVHTPKGGRERSKSMFEGPAKDQIDTQETLESPNSDVKLKKKKSFFATLRLRSSSKRKSKVSDMTFSENKTDSTPSTPTKLSNVNNNDTKPSSKKLSKSTPSRKTKSEFEPIQEEVKEVKKEKNNSNGQENSSYGQSNSDNSKTQSNENTNQGNDITPKDLKEGEDDPKETVKDITQKNETKPKIDDGFADEEEMEKFVKEFTEKLGLDGFDLTDDMKGSHITRSFLARSIMQSDPRRSIKLDELDNLQDYLDGLLDDTAV